MGQRAPRALGSAGKALFQAITADYDVTGAEGRLLVEACRCADRLDALEAVIARDGVVSEGKVLSSALVEARQQQLVLARLIASLRLPQDDGEGGRPQRRGGARGAYGAHNLRFGKANPTYLGGD